MCVTLVGCSVPNSSPIPSPALSPVEVARIQAEALRRADEPVPNAGIWTTYQFASPGNRKITGPYGRFLRIIKSPENRSFREARSVRVGEPAINGDSAKVPVELIAESGQIMVWIFSLSRQTEGPCRGCWMTDGVVRQK